MASPPSPASRPPLQDEASWRLPDWETYSESDASGWTNDDFGSDSDASLRVPRVARSTTTLTRVDDLRALHRRFAQERQRAAADSDGADQKSRAELLGAQAQIAAQLTRVREELHAFQHEWQQQSAREKDDEPTATHEAATVTAAHTREESGALRFDMAVQTDVAGVHDDALRQWLFLITQKMEVLTASFHGDTTQLPLRYPLRAQLDRPVSFSASREEESAREDAFSVASWHVGGQLKALVGEETAEKLLDLERAVACLATATHHTTTRYVEYFETIVVQIQDLHQQRLRQVVDESLQEMKTQRTKYKKRVEQLETECRAAKDEVLMWQQKATAATHLNVADTERLEAIVSARQQQWDREREHLVTSIELLQREEAERGSSKSDAETRIDELKTQLAQMTKLLEVAQQQSDEKTTDARAKDEQMRQLKQQHRIEMERFENIHTQLRDEILQFQKDAERTHHEMAKKHAQELENAATAAAATKDRDFGRLKREHEKQIEAIEQKWRAKLEDAEETKMLAPVAVSVDQQVQTDPDLVDEGTTDERIARLKKRCKALESLLDKKFEDSSAASVASMDSAVSGRWSSRSESRFGGANDEVSGDMASRTLPLTMSFESSLDGTMTSTHPANTPSRDDMKRSPHDVWETISDRSGRSVGLLTSTVASKAAGTDSDAPTPEAMLKLVRKLEALATTNQLPGTKAPNKQPDEEPDLSAATTPTRKLPASSRPTSASLKKSGWASSRSSGLAGSYSTTLHSLKDPRRQQQQRSGKTNGAESAGPTSAASSVTKSRQQHQRTPTRFTSR